MPEERTLTGGWPDHRSAYDAVAADYAAAFAGELADKPFDRAVLEALAYRVGPRGLVADVGCGPAGQIGAYVAGLGPRVVGVDVSPVCARSAPLPAAAGDLRALPLIDGCLAAAVCFYAVIHLPRTLVPRALAELARVLRPGGELVLTAHRGDGELTEHGWFGHDLAVRVTLLERAELHGLLAAAGLTDVRVASRDAYPTEYPTHRLYATARKPGNAGHRRGATASGGSGPARSG